MPLPDMPRRPQGLTASEKFWGAVIASAIGGLHFVPTGNAVPVEVKDAITSIYRSLRDTNEKVGAIQTSIAVINNNREADKNEINDHEIRLRSIGH